MTPPGLDPDLLRAFLFIAEEGSFTRAAQRVGRTQSAVSMQVQRLEATLGQRLLSRAKGGAVQLTPHGQFLLSRARQMLSLNDQIWTSFHTPSVQGTVRLGVPDDYALRYLPVTLRRFAERHPSVQVAVQCLPSELLAQRLREGALDLAICSEGRRTREMAGISLWRGPLCWVTSASYPAHRQDPLPLALGEQCSWSEAALQALGEAGRPYRLAYSAASLMGTIAPVLAGLAVTVSTTAWLPEGLRVLRPEDGMPALPHAGISLLKGADAHQPVTDALAEYISETFRAERGPELGSTRAA